MIQVNKVAFIGSADAQKSAIILECVLEFNLLSGRELSFITDSNHGRCIDICTKNKVGVITLQSEDLADELNISQISALKIDLLISIGWPKLIPELFLNQFSVALNCHGSVLPDYRGSRAYMHYYANCSDYYGASIHYMNAKFDDGNVLVQGKMKLFDSDSSEIVHRHTAELCAYLIPFALEKVEKCDPGYQPQGRKRYFFKLTPEQFESYRRSNLENKHKGLSVTLTPHKELS